MQYLIPSEKKQVQFDGKNYPIFSFENYPDAILDKHLAEIYHVTTKELNQAQKRNPKKFQNNWAFQPKKEEILKVTLCDLYISQPLTHIPTFYSWEGSNMVATILRSDIATQRAIQIVKGFTAVEKTFTKYSNHPLMKMAQQTMQSIVISLENKEKLELQEKRINTIEAKQDAILNQSGYYSILGYANLLNLKMGITEAARLGRKASKLSQGLGVKIDKVKDPRFGKVGAYHESILKEVFLKPKGD